MDKVDVHIIQHPTQDRSEYLHPLLESLESEPVNVHLIQGVTGTLGGSRVKGFRSGTSEYKSYLDDDDAIVPGVFDKILECFASEDRISGCCTREAMEIGGRAKEFPFRYYDPFHIFHIHHITAYKFSAIARHLDTIKDVYNSSEHSLAGLVLLDGAIMKHIPEIGYIYTKRKTGAHAGASAEGIRVEGVAKDIYKRICDMTVANKLKSVIEGQGSIDKYTRMLARAH